MTDHDSATGRPLPLEGIRVVEFGQYIAVPAATQLLVDQGATVIKVEPPQGESARHGGGYGLAMVQSYNRGKLMATIDLRLEEDQEFARQLIASCDVMVSNLRPGVLERFGLGIDSLLAAKSDLISVTLTGFGRHPSFQGRSGLDIAAQAESGLMWTTGEASGEPQRAGSPIIDAATGYVIAQTISSALLGRERHGIGSVVEINLWDVAIHMQAVTWSDYERTGIAAERKGNGHPTSAPGADVYEVQDGYVVISAYMPPHWESLCRILEIPEALEDPDLIDATTRAKNRPKLTALLESALKRFTRDEVVTMLSSGGVVVGAIREIGEVVQLRGIGADSPFLQPAEGDTEAWQIGTPYSWEGVPAVPSSARPVGADDEYVRGLVRADRANQRNEREGQ